MPYVLAFIHPFTVSDRDRYNNDCCFAGDLITEKLLRIS
jgi:hypothetical protein